MTPEEHKTWCREYARKKRMEGQELVPLKCKECGSETLTKKYLLSYFRRKGGKKCKACVNLMSGERLRKLRLSKTPEEISAHARFARSKADCSKGVSKQWERFRSNPEKFKQICQAKSNRMKKVWQEYDDETKNHIAQSLTKSLNKARSTSSDALKQAMIEKGLYEGFKSEEPFHGFLPDEINHSLKIIVEMYGDVYHCNPKKYKDPTQFLKIIGRTVQEQWKRDERRIACFYKHGYSVVIVWDSDFRSYPKRELTRIAVVVDQKKNNLRTVPFTKILT